MNKPTKYILYCAQEANFQTRSMLIPYDLIMKCEHRVKDLEVLRAHSKKNVTFNHQGQKYVVDQLLVENITWEGNCGNADKTPFTKIVGHFTNYADGMNWDDGFDGEEPVCLVSKSGDEEWVKNTIGLRPGTPSGILGPVASSGFNHVTNYCDFRNKTEHEGKPIDIVEGFLVLQSNNGKLKMPPVDTVAEMYQTYYS